MDRYRRKASSLFTRLAGGLSGRKPRPAISTSPAPQTGLSTASQTSVDTAPQTSLSTAPQTYSVSTAPQTSLSTASFLTECQSNPPTVFELPDELILSILSYVAPHMQYTSHWVRFRLLHDKICDDGKIRARFLRRLSATCRTMRLRLAPWLWEHFELSTRRAWDEAGETAVRNLNAIANALSTDTSLATSVKYLCTSFPVFASVLIHAL